MSSLVPVATPAAQEDNRLLWRPASRREHVESLFLKLNVPDSREALWLQFGARTLRRRAGAPHCHVMAVRFDAQDPSRTVAVKRRYAPDQLSFAADRLWLQVDGNVLESGRTRGSIESGGHTVSWELTFDTPRSGLRHYPWSFLYHSPLPRTKATTPALDTRFDGWFEVDGRRTSVTRCPGMQGHNWGSRHAERWAWTHGNQFTGAHPEAAEAVFEGLTGRIRIGPWPTPWLSLAYLRYGHMELRFDTLRQPFSIRGVPEPDRLRWEFQAADRYFRLTGVAQAPPERWIAVDYASPEGRVVSCMNSSVAALELHVEERDRGFWRTVDTLRSAETAALELAGPEGHPGVATRF